MTPDRARLLLHRLRRMQDATRLGKRFVLPEGTVSRLDLVERRLLAAIERDQTPGPAHDGYPSGNLGPGGIDAPQSSAEGAALAGYRIPQGQNIDFATGTWEDAMRDPHHDLTVRATQHLEQATKALDGLLAVLDDIDKKADPKTWRTDPAGNCQACGRHVEGTAADRLRSGYCMADYQAWLREDRPDRPAFERRRRQDNAA